MIAKDRRWLGSAIAVGAAAVVIIGFYLTYKARRLGVPLGWDTSKYLWRTALARSIGIDHLEHAMPLPQHGDAGRPGFVAVAATLSSVLRASPFRIATVLPPVAAAAVGLAAGAFAGATLRRSTWLVVVVALAVGLSAFVIRLMGPETYQDNLLAGAVFLAAAIPLGAALEDRAALVPAVLLLGAGGIVHWAFFLFLAAAILGAAVLYLPASWRARRHGLLRTPAATMVAATVGGAAMAALGIFGVLAASTREPHLSRNEFAKKLASDLPRYRLPIVVPVAAVGAASLAVDATRAQETRHRAGARFALALLGSWCAVALAGYLAFRVLHVDLPAHRFLAFALAVPLLAGLGVAWAGELLARMARPLGIAVVVAVLVAEGLIGHQKWNRTQPLIQPNGVRQSALAAGYLDAAHVAVGRPVVVIIGSKDGNYVGLSGNMVRASMPAARIPEVYLFAGAPEDYLARRATPFAGTTISTRYLGYLRGTYDRDPVAFLLQEFGPRVYLRWVAAHPASEVANGVAVVRGPVVPWSRIATVPPLSPLHLWVLGLLALGTLLALAAAGSGWTWSLLRRAWVTPSSALAAMPAVGIAAIVVTAIVLDRLGVRLIGGGGVACLLVAVGLGWVEPLLARRRRPSGSTPGGAGAGA